MEQPTFVFNQHEILKGMTSSLKSGACWGLTVAWLRDCFSIDPGAAGVAMTEGSAKAHEAVIAHDARGNQFLSGTSDDNNIMNGVVMMSSGQFDAARDGLVDGAVSAGAGIAMSKAMAITAAMSSADGDYHGMIIFTCSWGRHAMAVAKCNNTWALFDPNHGTWTYASDSGGAPVPFGKLLKDNLESYRVTEVNLFKIAKLF